MNEAQQQQQQQQQAFGQFSGLENDWHKIFVTSNSATPIAGGLPSSIGGVRAISPEIVAMLSQPMYPYSSPSPASSSGAPGGGSFDSHAFGAPVGGGHYPQSTGNWAPLPPGLNPAGPPVPMPASFYSSQQLPSTHRPYVNEPSTYHYPPPQRVQPSPLAHGHFAPATAYMGGANFATRPSGPLQPVRVSHGNGSTGNSSYKPNFSGPLPADSTDHSFIANDKFAHTSPHTITLVSHHVLGILQVSLSQYWAPALRRFCVDCARRSNGRPSHRR